MKRWLSALFLALSVAPAFAAPPPPVPALPDTERRTSYSLSASTCACSVGFALYGDSTDYQNWLEVFINGVRVNYNDATYGWAITSPTGSLASIPRPVTDAVLTFTNAQTGTIQIVGARRPRRTSTFSENRGVPARDLNQILNDMIAQSREVWDKTNDVTGRALMSQPGVTLGLLPLPSVCVNGFLGFDGTGLVPVCRSSGGTSNVTLPVVSGNLPSFNGTTGLLADSGLPLAGLSGLSANVQGTGIPGLDSGHWFIWNNPTAAFDGTETLRIDRHANVGSGTIFDTYGGIQAKGSTNPGNAGFEWNYVGQFNNTSRPGAQSQNGSGLFYSFKARAITGTTAAAGNGATATVFFASQGNGAPVVFPIGSVVLVSGVTPSGYNGLHTVTASGVGNVSFASTTTGAQTVAGMIGPATLTASGTGTTATITFSGTDTMRVGDTVMVSDVTPTGYNGKYVITASAPGSVSYANTTTGAQTVAGMAFDISVGPTWGQSAGCFDRTGDNNPVASCVGSELDIEVDNPDGVATTDTNAQRVGLFLAAKSNAAGTHVGTGVAMTTDANTIVDHGYSYAGAFGIGIDFSAATFSTAPIFMAENQRIVLDGATGGTFNRSLYFFSGKLIYATQNGNVLQVDDSGSIQSGANGVAGGALKLLGLTSGTVTIQPQSAAGTYNFNLPAAAGSSGQVMTSGGGVTSPMTWTTLAPVATSGSASDLSTGTVSAGRLPALTGDVTSSAGSAATAFGAVAGTSYTPTLACGSGTLTSASATGTYRVFGKYIYTSITATITTNGTCAVAVNVTMPPGFTAHKRCIMAGREDGVGGKMLQGTISDAGVAAVVANYDNTYPGANGAILAINGMCESN